MNELAVQTEASPGARIERDDDLLIEELDQWRSVEPLMIRPTWSGGASESLSSSA